MPSTPLLDLSTVDLTKTVATHDKIYAVLKQAGTFALLDEVCHFETEGDLVVGRKRIKEDAWWAKDHIPGRPIFPGALMIETGAQLCSWDFLRRRVETEDIFLGFGGTNSTRFRGLVSPGEEMFFIARNKRIRKTMFTYDVQGFVAGKLVFETEIMGVVV